MSIDKQQSFHQDKTMDDEIDLMEMWAVLVKYKRMIRKYVLVSVAVAVVISLLMPNIYEGEILLAPAQSDSSQSGLSSALGGMGGFASMAGLSLGGGGSIPEYLAVLNSREFLWQFVQKNNLMPILFASDWDEQKKRWKDEDVEDQPGQWQAYRMLTMKGLPGRDNAQIEFELDDKTGLVKVTLQWTDAALSAKWANSLIADLNHYLAKQAMDRSERNLKYLREELARTQVEEMRKVLFDLIASEQKSAMLANTQRDFAFKVLDPAIEPNKKTKPKRALLVILAAILAGFVGALTAFIKEGIAKRKEEAAEGEATA
ncbi:MAG: Wzz/FepE/Etk N-terminal domain-containing protein [Gallionella sp.]